ncbi:AGAP000261-PA-like protein [Anopheles sinensis]|uniref:AGAP000261-PA-like protein n=1 Tax=Anopheles sinensis TaxID=74873 RepID=A0A084VX69_ANOSI|nr:AGAP000261-PA-like protein [Anopheles sinensis]
MGGSVWRTVLVLSVAAICWTTPATAHGWGSEDMELFDLVEEVNENFYQLMNISQTATLAEIKRAFRTLSIVLHPDKNDAEDANIKFRNLVSVYETLRDPTKREKYDKVLKEGMPNWKSAIYYYRHVRKMGMVESATILFVVITVMQYFVAWAAYVEKKYTAEQIVGSKLKKLNKRKQTNVQLEELINEIPLPSIKNTLPFQIPWWVWSTITGTPGAIRGMFEMYNQQKKLKEEELQREQEEIELQASLEEQRAKDKENRTLRKRTKKMLVPEKTDEELAAYSQSILKPGQDTKETTAPPPQSGGLWTEDDLTELVRLVKKYPGGTANRWELIADMMQRSVEEITYMAAKMKECGYRLPHQAETSVAETLAAGQVPAKVKTKTRDSADPAAATSTWSQQQQQALEVAIQKYPKSANYDRWQKIASSVPGKSKEECIARYKYLVELVKKQKTTAAAADNDDDSKASTGHEPPQPEPASQPAGESVPSATDGTSRNAEEEKEEAAGGAAQGGHSESVRPGGKSSSKSRRRERKKANAYYSYSDDSDMSNEPGEI